jgi:hypothetical protein
MPKHSKSKSKPSNRLSYTYQDQSLIGLASGDNFAIQRQRQFLQLRWQVKLLFIVLTVMCASLLPLHYTLAYHSYQQSTCTITDKQLQEHDSTNKSGNVTSRWYYPWLAYDVHTIGGELVSTTGFDGPLNKVSYDDQDSAQKIIDRYQVGQTTICWYNPIESEKAFIIFYGYTISDALTTFLWCLLAFSALAAFVYWLFDRIVWRPYALAKRGVVTQGTVRRREVRGTNGSFTNKYTVSIIGFQTAEEPKRDQYVTVGGKLKRNCPIPICYDPFYPRYRRYGEWPPERHYRLGLISIALLLCISLIITIVLWLIP